MNDPRVVMLARMRVGSGAHAASGSMADDLGRLAAGVVLLDMFVQRLWVAVQAAAEAESATCSYSGTRCGFGQHSIECAVTRAKEALSLSIDDCPTEAIKKHIANNTAPTKTVEAHEANGTTDSAR